MIQQKHERFVLANNELRRILQQAQDAANGTCTVTDSDLQTFSRRLSNCDFSVGEASRSETLDAELRYELAEYVRNLRSIQKALEKVRVLTLARRMSLETKRPHSSGLNGCAGKHPFPE